MFAAINSFLTRAVTGYFLNKSLRFRSSASAYLNRTPATATNQTTWTWSGWVKRGTLGQTYRNLFGVTGGVNDATFAAIYFGANGIADTLGFQGYSSVYRATTAVYRDPAAWYHIVVAVDTTQATAANRVLMYVNGDQITSFATSVNPSPQSVALPINSTSAHQIGRDLTNGGYYDGEMAEINFVDGQALAPTAFGAYSTYNQWLPIAYAGTYGTNGFYLPFGSNNTTAAASYLVVAGGGGGGNAYGGGGGGGGLLSGSATIAPGSVYSVTVGTGGLGATSSGRGASGSDSSFGTIATATGGGGGGGIGAATGGSGGSGGGGGDAGTGAAGGSATSGQGFAGGAAFASLPGAAGGGGGAGAVGGTGTSALGGTGGAGLASSISGSSVTYAGGGGGNAAGVNGGGGTGGGGAAGNPATNGTANLGGGGGGSGTTSGNGGSGVVIVSYAGAQLFTGGTVTTSGGNTIHSFTTSGTLTGIFNDASGNANNWTPNNISLTAGSTYDSLTDVPTLTSTTVANYAVLNPINPKGNSTVSNGNLTEVITTVTGAGRGTTIAVTSGKFYVEATAIGGGAMVTVVGITSPSASTYQLYLAGVGYYSNNGNKYISGVSSAYGTAWSTAGTYVIGMALDVGAGTIQFYLNNVAQGSITLPTMPSDGWIFVADWESSAGSVTYNWNYGQQPFVYTAPSGFLPLNTFNI
jgi:hypothetical protein